jgi:uncharacterized protein (DUF433 family)
MTPGVCGGRPDIAGSRMTVDFVARYLQSGIDAKALTSMLSSALHERQDPNLQPSD